MKIEFKKVPQDKKDLKNKLSKEAFENGIKDTFAAKPKLIDVNLKVLEAGATWLRENR